MTGPAAAGGEALGGLSRRQFLQALAGTSVGAVMFTGCQVPQRELQAQSRVLLAEDLLSAYENWYATACRGCGAGCGSIVRVIDGRARKVEGTPDHPVNQGKLCARGQAAVQAQYHPDRVQGPLVRAGARGGGFAPIGWDQGLAQLVDRLRGAGGGAGPRLALLTGPTSGHRALVIDRFTRAAGAQWLMLDLFGEAPLRRAVSDVLGLPRLPHFDVANAQYVLSFGANFLDTWLSPVQYGVQYGRFRQGDYSVGTFAPRQGRPRGYLAHVGPHFSGTAANADEWVYVHPGSEGLLALSLAQVILSEGLAAGSAAGLSAGALAAYAPERVADATGVAADRIRGLARDFATRAPSLALGGGQTGAQTNGTATLSAVLALNLLVGALGRAGGILPNPAPPLPDVPASTPLSRLSCSWRTRIRSTGCPRRSASATRCCKRRSSSASPASSTRRRCWPTSCCRPTCRSKIGAAPCPTPRPATRRSPSSSRSSRRCTTRAASPTCCSAWRTSLAGRCGPPCPGPPFRTCCATARGHCKGRAAATSRRPTSSASGCSSCNRAAGGRPARPRRPAPARVMWPRSRQGSAPRRSRAPATIPTPWWCSHTTPWATARRLTCRGSRPRPIRRPRSCGRPGSR